MSPLSHILDIPKKKQFIHFWKCRCYQTTSTTMGLSVGVVEESADIIKTHPPTIMIMHFPLKHLDVLTLFCFNVLSGILRCSDSSIRLGCSYSIAHPMLSVLILDQSPKLSFWLYMLYHSFYAVLILQHFPKVSFLAVYAAVLITPYMQHERGKVIATRAG